MDCSSIPSFRKATSTNLIMNRFFALFAFVAAALAEPEADPQLLVYGAHATSGGLVKHFPSGAVTPDDTNAVKVAKAQHLAAKGLAYAYRAPYAYAPYTYGYAPYTAAYSYAVPHTLAKREADAEAEADPQYFYNGYYGSGYAHTYGLPYAYTHVASAPVVTKTEVKEVKPATVKYVAAPATYAYAAPYASYSYPYASYALAKRDAEAEPEADPAPYYGNYYSGYRYPYASYASAY